MTRVATVTATGKRYVVQRLTIGSTPADTRVHCWGEVTAYRTGRGATREERLATSASMTHATSKCFVGDAVTIAEMPHDGHLAQLLLEQGAEVLGFSVVRGARRR